MIDFFGSGYDVAEKMGILDKLEAIHYPISRLAFLDGTGCEKYAISSPAFRRIFDDRHFNFAGRFGTSVALETSRRTVSKTPRIQVVLT